MSVESPKITKEVIIPSEIVNRAGAIDVLNRTIQSFQENVEPLLKPGRVFSDEERVQVAKFKETEKGVVATVGVYRPLKTEDSFTYPFTYPDKSSGKSITEPAGIPVEHLLAYLEEESTKELEKAERFGSVKKVGTWEEIEAAKDLELEHKAKAESLKRDHEILYQASTPLKSSENSSRKEAEAFIRHIDPYRSEDQHTDWVKGEQSLLERRYFTPPAKDKTIVIITDFSKKVDLPEAPEFPEPEDLKLVLGKPLVARGLKGVFIDLFCGDSKPKDAYSKPFKDSLRGLDLKEISGIEGLDRRLIVEEEPRETKKRAYPWMERIRALKFPEVTLPKTRFPRIRPWFLVPLGLIVAICSAPAGTGENPYSQPMPELAGEPQRLPVTPSPIKIEVVPPVIPQQDLRPFGPEPVYGPFPVEDSKVEDSKGMTGKPKGKRETHDYSEKKGGSLRGLAQYVITKGSSSDLLEKEAGLNGERLSPSDEDLLTTEAEIKDKFPDIYTALITLFSDTVRNENSVFGDDLSGIVIEAPLLDELLDQLDQSPNNPGFAEQLIDFRKIVKAPTL